MVKDPNSSIMLIMLMFFSGKTVLHLDINRFYGEQWSSFTLTGLENFAKDTPPSIDSELFSYRHFMQNLTFKETPSSKLNQENQNLGQEKHENIHKEENTEKNVDSDSTEPNKEKVEPAAETIPLKPSWTSEKLQKSKRRVNIDVTPKLCYSAGSMVDLLRSSNCSRYLEFKAVNRSFVHYQGELIQAPCNREQVFNCKHLKVLEKRIMMKFVTFALQVGEDSEEFLEWDKKEDIDLYRSFKLTDGLINLVRASLVVSSKEKVSAHEVIRSIKFYLKNIGIYGSMPFICPIYGAGELPQAFARFSAVFGSIYVLDIAPTQLSYDETGKFSGLTLQTGQKLTGKYCVVSPNYTSKSLPSPTEGLVSVSHAVYLTDSSIKPKTKAGEQDDVSILHILPGCLDNPRPVSGFEFGPRSMLPAEDMYMVHLTTPSAGDDPAADLESVVDKITDSTVVLYKLFFTTQMSAEGRNVDPILDKNIIRTTFPTYNAGYSECIEEARKSFNLLFPEEEFLPAAPNPEDIKWPDEDEVEVEVSELSEKLVDDLDKSEADKVAESGVVTGDD